MLVQSFPKPKVHKHHARNNPKPTADDICWQCLQAGVTTPYAALHEVFHGTGYRQLSIDYKMQIRLCPFHHQDTKEGIHFNREFDYRISKMYQKIFIEQYSKELFNQVFGDNMVPKELKHAMLYD